MKRTPLAVGLIAVLSLPLGVLGQESRSGSAARPAAQPETKPEADPGADMAAVPLGPEHEMLKQFEGTWRARVQMYMDGAVNESEGTMTNSLVLDGRFLRQDFESEFMEHPFRGLGYWGYDRASKQWITSWMDTWNTGMMVSEKGSYDAAARTWTIDAKYTNPETGKKETHREVIKLIDADEHVMDMFMVDDAGNATKSMTITYTRMSGAKGEGNGQEKKQDKAPRRN